MFFRFIIIVFKTTVVVCVSFFSLHRLCQVQVRAGHRVDSRERDLRKRQRPERCHQG